MLKIFFLTINLLKNPFEVAVNIETNVKKEPVENVPSYDFKGVV